MIYIKFLIIYIILLSESILNINCQNQCPIANPNLNCINNVYCFCPYGYDQIMYTYNNGLKCKACIPDCNYFDCSLKYCHCKEGYIKTKLNECYKCLLNLIDDSIN